MARDLIKVSYIVTFTAPFHCGTGQGDGLLDRVVRRSANGQLVLPGSTLKGILRAHCEQLVMVFDRYVRAEYGAELPGMRVASPHDERPALAEYRPGQSLLTRIFGSRVVPGTVYFDDAALDASSLEMLGPGSGAVPLWQTEERTQVSMSRRTGGARRGMLFTSEYGMRDLVFTGVISGTIEDWPLPTAEIALPGNYALAMLLGGLHLVERIGGQKSAGIGSCTLRVTTLDVNRSRQQVEAYLALLDTTFADYYALAGMDGE